MDNFFSSPRLFDDLDGHKINSCRTVRPNRKDMPCDFGPKQLKLKRGDVRVKTRGGVTALVWKDRQEVYMLTNMDPPPAEGNFCDDSNCPVGRKTKCGSINYFVRLESRHNQHWPAKSTQLRCRLCSSCGQRKTTVYKSAKCKVGLCVVPCFVDYHTKVNLYTT